MRFEIPEAGSLVISRHGEVNLGMGFGLRYRWRFAATDTQGNVFRSWGTAPEHTDVDGVFSLACDSIAYEIEKFTGDDTGNEWSLMSSDVEGGTDHAAFYAVTPLFYRTSSWAYDPDGDTFPTKKALRESILYHYRMGWYGEGYTEFVYRNNADEPDGYYVVGPRGGLKWENY